MKRVVDGRAQGCHRNFWVPREAQVEIGGPGEGPSSHGEEPVPSGPQGPGEGTLGSGLGKSQEDPARKHGGQ